MRKPKRQFQELFQASDAGEEQRSRTSRKLLTAFPRRLRTTSPEAWQSPPFLEELKLADAKQLAKELLARLKTSINNRRGLENISAAVVTQILRLDPSQSGGVIAAVLPESDEMPVELRAR